MPDPPRLRKIISGGQTGVDRAALDAALDAGFPCGGWCPKASAVDQVLHWLHEHAITTLNIAGPRAGKEPRAYIYTYDLVTAIIARSRKSTTRAYQT